MPYCNQCGRYIGGGMLCAWCGDTGAKKDDENCRGMDGMPTPDGASMQVDKTPPEQTEDSEVPGNTGTTPFDDTEDDPMDVTEGAHVPGDINGEVVSEGRTIVTTPEEEETPRTETDARETPREGIGAKLGAKIGEWIVKLFAPGEGEASFSPSEMRAGRSMAILCYLGVLWAIPYFRARSRRYVAHHLERGLNILLLGCLGLTLGAAALVVGVIAPFVMPLLAAASEVVLLAAASMSIWSIVRVCTAQRMASGSKSCPKG